MQTTIPATAIEIYRSLPEGTRCEVLYNQLIMTPAPSTIHQSVSARISALLYAFLEETKKGVVYTAPTDVYLEDLESVVQPDVLVVLKENESIIHDDGIYGAPDIIFEILSGNGIHDTIRKKALYEDAGVKEYFIINPSDKMVLMFARGNQNKFEWVYEIKGKITSEVLGISIDL
jgi:Uma2 family endonuclease